MAMANSSSNNYNKNNKVSTYSYSHTQPHNHTVYGIQHTATTQRSSQFLLLQLLYSSLQLLHLLRLRGGHGTSLQEEEEVCVCA